jgi:hypothetical protein
MPLDKILGNKNVRTLVLCFHLRLFIQIASTLAVFGRETRFAADA